MSEAISPLAIVLQPPNKLVLETRFSGGYFFVQWLKDGAGADVDSDTFPFVFQDYTHFFEIYVKSNTTLLDMGLYDLSLNPLPGTVAPPRLQFAVIQFGM